MIAKGYSFIDLIKSDMLARPYVVHFSWKGLLKMYFTSPLFRFQFWLRFSRYCKKHKLVLYSPIGVYSFLRFRHLEYKYGVHIGTHIEIGPGLHVVHGDGIYVNVKSIGSNFTVYQSVTFGSIKDMHKPIIGDNVTVNPGAVIYGDVVLHDGCIVGANSVVNKDVAENDVVVGAPAHSIKRK